MTFFAGFYFKDRTFFGDSAEEASSDFFSSLADADVVVFIVVDFEVFVTPSPFEATKDPPPPAAEASSNEAPPNLDGVDGAAIPYSASLFIFAFNRAS